jgi:hypothetical protein
MNFPIASRATTRMFCSAFEHANYQNYEIRPRSGRRQCRAYLPRSINLHKVDLNCRAKINLSQLHSYSGPRRFIWIYAVWYAAPGITWLRLFEPFERINWTVLLRNVLRQEARVSPPLNRSAYWTACLRYFYSIFSCWRGVNGSEHFMLRHLM